MKKKHYLVYKTTNLVNGKIYIGKHETDDIDDGYLGSGILIQRAIEKYGEENFKREILFECSTREEMNAKEAELVNEEFLKRDDVYNIKLGGEGGFDFINVHGINNSGDNAGKGGRRNVQLLKDSQEHREKFSARISSGLKRVWKEQPELFRNFKFDWTGKHHTEETKRKISESIGDRHGEKNNAFGTVWIYNENTKQNKMVKKELMSDFLNNGWKVGRRMDFYK